MPKPTRERMDIRNTRYPIASRTGWSMRNPFETEAILLSSSAETPLMRGHLQRTEKRTWQHLTINLSKFQILSSCNLNGTIFLILCHWITVFKFTESQPR